MYRIKSAFVVLLVLSLILVTFPQIGVVTAEATIYIRSDGSVTGTDKIQRNGDIYSFTGNVSGSIVVEKDGVVIDGNGFWLEGSGSISTTALYEYQGDKSEVGITLNDRTDVTIQNLQIINYGIGIAFDGSSNNTIFGNQLSYIYGYPGSIFLNNSNNNMIAQNSVEVTLQLAIALWNSNSNQITENKISSNLGTGIIILGSNNTISGNVLENNGDHVLTNLGSENMITGNNMTGTGGMGIGLLHGTDGNKISRNNIYQCNLAIACYDEHNNTFFENNIVDNDVAVEYSTGISNNYNNTFYCNNFINNTKLVYINYGRDTYSEPANSQLNDHWDNGTQGNYWSDYANKYPDAKEMDDTGIWDTPYALGENYQDNYPLIEPIIIPEFPSWIVLPIILATLVFLVYQSRLTRKFAN